MKTKKDLSDWRRKTMLLTTAHGLNLGIDINQ